MDVWPEASEPAENIYLQQKPKVKDRLEAVPGSTGGNCEVWREVWLPSGLDGSWLGEEFPR